MDEPENHQRDRQRRLMEAMATMIVAALWFRSTVPTFAPIVPRKPDGTNDADWGQFSHWLFVCQQLSKIVEGCQELASPASVILFHFPSLPRIHTFSQRLMGWFYPLSPAIWLQNLRQRLVMPCNGYDASTKALRKNVIAFRPTATQIAQYAPWFTATYPHLMQTPHTLPEQCEQISEQMLHQLAAAGVAEEVPHTDSPAVVEDAPHTDSPAVVEEAPHTDSPAVVEEAPHMDFAGAGASEDAANMWLAGAVDPFMHFGDAADVLLAQGAAWGNMRNHNDAAPAAAAEGMNLLAHLAMVDEVPAPAVPPAAPEVDRYVNPRDLMPHEPMMDPMAIDEHHALQTAAAADRVFPSGEPPRGLNALALAVEHLRRHMYRTKHVRKVKAFRDGDNPYHPSYPHPAKRPHTMMRVATEVINHDHDCDNDSQNVNVHDERADRVRNGEQPLYNQDIEEVAAEYAPEYRGEQVAAEQLFEELLHL
eukprot:TRINITY_DN2863_c0_g1_i2.p1 TRINITY_DN2863_c0_g1~~TRINITY_DN2863_c0_g1_i2.p1  ORF type:complete len:478 (-),score=96.14 TRINITY_DN2863_c0_g1_i2:102-1535(-)